MIPSTSCVKGKGNRVERSVKLLYYYYTDDNSGVMGNIGVTVYPKPDCDLETQTHFIQLRHKNLLQCYFINTKRREIGYSTFDSSFDEWIEELKKQKILPILSAHFPSKKIKTTYVPHQFRIAIRSLVKVVSYLHEQGFCTTGFSHSNLCIEKGGLRVWQIQLTTRSDEGIKKDYKCICKVLDHLFSQVTEVVPKDMQDLLSLLHAGVRSGLIATHLAILTHEQRCTFLRNCSEKEHTMDSSNEFLAYDDALISLGNQHGWTQKINSDHGPLCDSFKHRGSKYTDINPSVTPDPRTSMKRTNRSLIVCWRNLANFVCFKERDTDLMIMAVFGDLILNFQSNLFANGILPMFLNLEEEP